MEEELKVIEYLTTKRKEIKKLIENDEENINSFVVKEKINITKEKNENIKNMKNMILEHPNIFVKNAFFSKELKNNLKKTEQIFTDIYFNYENLLSLFKNETCKDDLSSLKELIELKGILIKDSKKDSLENIFKLPLALLKSNENQDIQECINYIKIASIVRQLLHHWYNIKMKEEKEIEQTELRCVSNKQNKYQVKTKKKRIENTPKENILFFKSYERCLKEEVEKTKNLLLNLIKKTENVDTLKKLILYLEEIHNYYACTKEDDTEEGSTKKKKIEESIKKYFLWLKHYDILETINEELRKRDITIYKIVHLFLTKVIHLKKIYIQLFDAGDLHLYKQITFLYYFIFSCLHFKVKGPKEKENINNFTKDKNNTYFLKFCNSVNEIEKEKVKEEECYLEDYEINYSFLNINTSIFNYMHYHVCPKMNDIASDSSEEEKEYEEFKEEDLEEHVSFENSTIINHSSFVENLYKEAERHKKLMKKKQSQYRFSYGYTKNTCSNGTVCARNFANKKTLLKLYAAIHHSIRNMKIKESTTDLFTYRNEYNMYFLSEKENNGLQISSFFYNMLNKIFVIYIYDFLQKNNLYFYKSVLLFDEHEKEISVNYKNMHYVVSEHIGNQKQFLKELDFSQFKKENAQTSLSLNTYYETIKEKLQYSFLVTYFNNLVFLLKSIKYYIDKSLYFVITYLFENAFKNFIENLTILFFKNQNVLLESKLFDFIKDVLAKYILPYTFLFLTCIFEVDVTSSTEKLFKLLEHWGMAL